MTKPRIIGQKAISILIKTPGMTKAKLIILIRKLKRLKNIQRDKPPTKGAFIRYLAKKGEHKLLFWTLTCKKLVLKELEELSVKDNNFRDLWEMENFQSLQKGPISPISARALVAGTIPKIVKASSIAPKPAAAADLLSQVAKVEERYKKYMNFESIDLTVINFGEEWMKLPKDSVRGLPYLLKGKEIDHEIVREYGNPIKKVLKKFRELDYLITTPGTRFQGSPKWDDAKVRLINIPSVDYQYLKNGLYQHIKVEMIKLPQMCGWLNPADRDKQIVKMWKRGRELGYTPIPIDFRAFDSKMFPEFRLAVTYLLLKVFKPSQQLDLIKSKLKELYFNQYLLAPSDECVLTLYPVDNLLGSGVANTQADGSTLNMVLQTYLCDKLGYQQPDDLGLTLGDDAVIWVPDNIMNELGYEGVLTFWQKCLDPLNMEIHIKKKYPAPAIFFLQKLYMPDKGIIGEYSIVRNIDSMVWAEHFREPIEGVHNHMALETIGQISTLNNSYDGLGKTTLKSIIPIFVREWLKVDQALTYLAQKSSKTKYPEGSLFGYLIESGGR